MLFIFRVPTVHSLPPSLQPAAPLDTDFDDESSYESGCPVLYERVGARSDPAVCPRAERGTQVQRTPDH